MKTCTVDGCNGAHEARGMCEKHYARWKRHGAPVLVTSERGTSVNAHGYRNFAGRLEHIAVAEKALGKTLPSGAIVHHMDYNKTNNAPRNLLVCSRAYHRIIHQRTDAYNACGHADWRKCSICGEYSPKEALSGFGATGTSGYHNACRREKYRQSKARSE